jgi:hypothetical protein
LTVVDDETIISPATHEVVAPLETAIDPTAPAPNDPDVDPRAGLGALVRAALPVVPAVAAVAVMMSGLFNGAGALASALLAGLLGVLAASAVARVRNAVLVNLLMPVSVFMIGLLLIAPSGPSAIVRVASLARAAAASGDLLRPPVPFVPGWQALLGWIVGLVGFVAGWVAVSIGRRSIALLCTLPPTGIAAVALPDSAKLAHGLAAVVLFVIALGLLSATDATAGMDVRPSLAYEAGRAARAVPIIAVCAGLVYALTRFGVLFPSPIVDPQNQAQKPRTVPLSQVEDRVLFEVKSQVTGPWRMGALDVYDGTDWRLPPFAQTQIADVPRSGLLDRTRSPGLKATITVAGLQGGVLPGLPRPVGIVASGPKLAFDRRVDTLRVSQGQVQAGITYTVTAAVLPTVDELKATGAAVPKDLSGYTQIPSAPPGIAALIDRAPKTSKWEEYDFLRTFVLDNVTAAGSGVPVPVSPERVNAMVTGPKKEGTPFEIVAAQAMLARWIGLPGRIGYGFDGGEDVGGTLQVRPRHGAVFVEVYFPAQGWLPIIGTPLKAKPTLGTDPTQQRVDSTVLPSDELVVDLTLPFVVAPPSPFLRQLRLDVVIATAMALVLILLWFTHIPLVKARARARARAAARQAGSRARVAVAYATWRDAATDYGFRHTSDTPLAFLARVIPDEEHRALAWIVTRCLWGDLRGSVTEDHAVWAEELSRALCQRLSSGQPASMRVVAIFSRLSMREPWGREPKVTRLRIRSSGPRIAFARLRRAAA